MKYNAAIFDLDGTLLNTLEDLWSAVNHTMDKYGYPHRTIQEVRSFVGNGVDRLIMLCLPNGSDDKYFEDAKLEYRRYYAEHSEEKTRPYDGIIDMIDSLENYGIKTAVVSNKIHIATVDLCKKYFPNIKNVCGERESEGIRRKPNPDMVIESARLLGVSLKDTVYIGDSEVDIETSRRAEVDCISVLWGFRDRDYLESVGGRVFAEKPADIIRIICEK
jgi:phosphoglycolate phosphatase